MLCDHEIGTANMLDQRFGNRRRARVKRAPLCDEIVNAGCFVKTGLHRKCAVAVHCDMTVIHGLWQFRHHWIDGHWRNDVGANHVRMISARKRCSERQNLCRAVFIGKTSENRLARHDVLLSVRDALRLAASAVREIDSDQTVPAVHDFLPAAEPFPRHQRCAVSFWQDVIALVLCRSGAGVVW
jgi:hypothetical protein